MTDLRTTLRAATSGLHERLEGLPFFAALQTGRLPKPAIVTLLRSLGIVHAVLERELSRATDQRLVALAAHHSPKLPLLLADLAALDTDLVPSETRAIDAALEAGAEILSEAANQLSLIGPLYVLEGSQAGGVALRNSFATCLGVPAPSLSYFGCYGSDTAARWSGFVTRLNENPLAETQTDPVVRGAVRLFGHLEKIFAALEPYGEQSLRHHVVAVNPEAGDHTMPQDPREIAVALRAGRSAWVKFPYLEARFGDRGRRFTSSDSCWLVALTDMPIATATKNLDWLRRVLSSRGIPTVILETHLREIATTLASDIPHGVARGARFEPFLAAREDERRLAGDDAARARLVERVEQTLARCDGLKVASAARLLASAWLDERSGLVGALAATHDWFTRPERFSPDWVAVVNELVTTLEHGDRSSW